MNNKRLTLMISSASLSAFCSVSSTSSYAALANDAVLSLNPGSVVCHSYGCPDNTGGSWFSMDPTVASFPYLTSRYALDSISGLSLGAELAASELEMTFHNVFWSNISSDLGEYSTSSPINVLSSSGNTATVDLSGLHFSLLAEPGSNYSLGMGAWDPLTQLFPGDQVPNSGPYTNGIALVTCAIDCASGDTYSLDYTATINGDSTLDGYQFYLHLEGTVSPVPVPPAVWLFGSGLLGLFCYGRSKANT